MRAGVVGPCVMGCEPDQYAVWVPNCPLLNDQSPDAMVFPTLPAGCSGVFPAVVHAIDSVTSTCPDPSLYCCPCQ